MYTFRVLLVILAATALAYATHVLLKRMIDPRRSVSQFLVYILFNLVAIFLWVFLFGLALNHYKDFFFKK